MPTATDRDAVIQQNMGLVHACAHRLKGRGIEYEDLFQAGCMGLVKATDAFDYNRGVRFSTYAVPMILGEIKRYIRDDGNIKVSRQLKTDIRRLRQIKDEYYNRTGSWPKLSYMAEKMDCSVEHLSN